MNERYEVREEMASTPAYHFLRIFHVPSDTLGVSARQRRLVSHTPLIDRAH